jgi:hypothetical protein
MNLSSRWCVTAVVAFGALGCSDPVPPPAQGAFLANVRSVSPPQAGKSCPSGASLTFDVPAVDPAAIPPKPTRLDADNYQVKIIDGEDQAEVSCSVKGGGSFTFEGSIKLGARALAISNGTIGADKKGTASIALRASGTPGFSGTLSAPSANCVIDAAQAPGTRFEVAPGRIWAHFQCPSVEQPPSDSCQADGYFVLENCDQ